MATADQIRQTVDAYVARFGAGDDAAWASLFAEDGTHEDPVGTEPHQGRAAIEAFQTSMRELTGGLRMALRDEPIVIGHEAVLSLEAWSGAGADRMHMPRIVDHITFAEDAHIQTIRAFWTLDSMVPSPE